MSKPFKSVGITRDALIAEMEHNSDPGIKALAARLKSTKGWTPDQLFELAALVAGKDPKDLLK